MRPKLPIPSFDFRLTTARPCQNQSAQWALKPAMPQTIFPWYVNVGMPHLMVSSMPEPPSWMTLRRRLKIGRANGAQPWMYSLTLGSRFGIILPPVRISHLGSDAPTCIRACQPLHHVQSQVDRGGNAAGGNDISLIDDSFADD